MIDLTMLCMHTYYVTHTFVTYIHAYVDISTYYPYKHANMNAYSQEPMSRRGALAAFGVGEQSKM